MAKAKIATLYVQIVPSMDGFFKEIERETKENLPAEKMLPSKKSVKGFFDEFKSQAKEIPKIFSETFAGIKSFKFSGLFEKGGVSKELGKIVGPEFQGTLKNSFKNVGSSFGVGLQKAGAGVTSALKTGVKAAGLGTMVAGGLALGAGAFVASKGLQRALSIEDAQASLKGLGYDAKQIAGVTDDVLAAVKGTAYSLDESMGVASTALAAGVPQGEGLTKYLKNITDVATITGSSVGEIGSILNKTKTAGKVYTQELNQLADRGLPVFQWLQDELGVTSEEFRKMVSSGQVSSEQLMAVIEKNIGGAAQASGDTVKGAWANTMAALGRLGAAGMAGSLPVIKDSLNLIMPVIDTLTEKLKPLADAFWETFGPKMVEFVGGMADKILSLIEQMGAGDFELFGGLAEALSALSPIMALLQAIGPLIPAIAEAIIPLVTELAAMLGPLLGELVEKLTPVLESLIGLIIEVFKMLAPILIDLARMIVPIISMLTDILLPVIWLIIEILKVILPPLIQFIGEIVKGVMVVLMLAVQGFMVIISGLVNAFIAVANAFGAGWTYMQIPVMDFPALATGGNIAASPGGTAVIVGEGGRAETVTDLGHTNRMINNTNRLVEMALSSSSSENTVAVEGEKTYIFNVYQQPGESSDELVSKIETQTRFNSLR